MDNYRLYSFVNYYLSHIQAGLQTAHLVSDLFVKYHKKDHTEHKIFKEWAKNNKTIIILKGGNNENIQQTYLTLCKFYGSESSCPLPVECFHEDAQSLGGLMTCCGVIIPKELFLAKRLEDSDNFVYVDEDTGIHSNYYTGTIEWILINMIKGCSLF